MAQSSQDLNLNVNVNVGAADASMGSLKKQLKEAQADVQALSDKFGATSKEAINAAKRAGELKDKIGDAKSLVDAFNPDAKFKALTASLSGVAGGFAAVQGGMALLGNESQDVQKALLKVQSAMALSQGLQAVGESIDSFKQLGAVIKNQVSGAFSTLKGAIAATGIGLLVVGVGLLIANFEKVKETLLKLFPDLSKFGDYVMNIVNAITDFVGVTSEAERANELLNSSLTKSNEALDRQIKVLEAQGGKEADIYRLKRERVQNQIKLLNDANDKEYKGRADLNAELEVLGIQESNRIKNKNEADKKERDRVAKEKLDEQIAYDKIVAENALKAKLAIQQTDIEDAAYIKDLEEKEKERVADEIIKKEEAAQYQLKQDLFIINTKKRILKEDADEQKKIDDAVTKNKIDNVNSIINILGSLNVIAGENEAIGKGLALTQIGIDTAQAISALVKNSEQNPMNAWTFGGAGVTQFLAGIVRITANIANAKRLLSSKSSAAPSMSGGGGGVPSMNPRAPIAPSLAQSAPTTLSQGTINDIGNQAIKTYVVESDMTSNQQRIAAIQQRARFS